MSIHEYTEANLRMASPEKCKHPITEHHSERSYGTMYYWDVCKFCGSRINAGNYQDW